MCYFGKGSRDETILNCGNFESKTCALIFVIDVLCGRSVKEDFGGIVIYALDLLLQDLRWGGG